MKLNVRPQFYLDVAEEVAYLAEHAGEDIAVHWAEAVWATVSELKKFPELGRLRPDLPFPSVRSCRVTGFARWLIFYGVREQTIVFYRVRHGAMNFLKLDFNS
jgi:plasmid stabilization system protein ParE